MLGLNWNNITEQCYTRTFWDFLAQMKSMPPETRVSSSLGLTPLAVGEPMLQFFFVA
jgi:hypothetical protein